MAGTTIFGSNSAETDMRLRRCESSIEVSSALNLKKRECRR
jgi:hypothetical protein